EEGVSLHQAWRDDRYQSLRQQMLNDERPKMCEGACYSQEAKGLFSKRQKFNSGKSSQWASGEITADILEPVIRYVDLAFSNICNLKCVMCSSHYSSSWAAQDERAVAEGIEFRRLPPPVKHLESSVIEEVLAWSPQLFGVLIKGGEPFVDDSCLAYLQKLGAQKLLPQFRAFVQTNGTRADEKVLQAIRGVPIDIGISIDGTSDIYEWVRGFSFSKLQQNIRTFCVEESVHKVMFHFTLSAYNIYNIRETVAYYQQLKKNYSKVHSFYFSGIVRQEWGNVFAIPWQERCRIASELRLAALDWAEDVVGLETVLAVLERNDSKEAYFFSTCQRWMYFCDRMRGKKLADIEPRLAAIFSPSDQEMLLSQRTLD
ncbi:MAG: twitch domain-containing radical SAM protein, partial [Bdellovibrionaceae bacterium]|nr:twitch domain-containing radical SAM protein [Pseudobdellovibrionaceae bacterium]